MQKKFSVYSRSQTTPHYLQLIEFYSTMHSEGYAQLRGNNAVHKPGEKAFPGKKTLDYRDAIKSICTDFQCKSLFDYGAGKAGHYSSSISIEDGEDGKIYKGLQDYWGIEDLQTWEPGLDNGQPEGKHDIVITVDVLEHCYLGDIFWIVDELFRLASKVVFANVACYPAKAVLPNGENVHTLVRTPDWWHGVFDSVAASHENIDYVLCCAAPPTSAGREHKWYRRHEVEAEIDERTMFAR